MVWLRLRSFDADATLTTAEVAPVPAASATDTPPSRETYYQIEEPAPSAPATSSQQARERQKRYEELLRTAPPGEPQPQQGEATSRITSATPAQQTPPPTLLQRVVKPIAEALGMKRQAPQTPPQMQPSRNTSSPPHETTSSGKPEQQAEKNPLTDEDSDVVPPRLLSLDFTPPVVQDGEQTIFAAMVLDDLSGVQSVSGVVVSPSGAQQGFACQREGDTGRFIARITVPREAASGTWNIRYLTLTDNARNTVSLNAQQGLPGNANFRVMSSASDSAGPVLKAVWLEQPSMSAGQKNNVMVQADDDKSGVGLVSGVFLSPKRQARIGFACRNTGGDMWQCPISPPACGDCGAWQLEQVQMQDKANNMTTARGDNAHVGQVRLQLMGDACDDTPPVVTSLSLAPPVVSNKETSVVIVTAVATDNQCGVASLSGQAFAPAGISSRIPFSFRATGDGQTFIGELKVETASPSGIWTIGWMQALDKGHNMRTYTANDPAIANVTFRVE